MTYYLTRAELNRNAPEHALKALIDPGDWHDALDAHHRLIWALFPGDGLERDFLWRAAGKGRFYILSAREPRPSPLFHPMQSRPFAPTLAVGDRLGFVLRANATRDRRSAGNEAVRPGTLRRPVRNRRVDIVAHAMRQRVVSRGSRIGGDKNIWCRETADTAAREWLDAQGKRRGFAIENLIVENYRLARLVRPNGKQASFGVVNLSGVLTVREPESFVGALVSGFGRSKAFGCGLMLVRRVHPPLRE